VGNDKLRFFEIKKEKTHSKTMVVWKYKKYKYKILEI